MSIYVNNVSKSYGGSAALRVLVDGRRIRFQLLEQTTVILYCRSHHLYIFTNELVCEIHNTCKRFNIR